MKHLALCAIVGLIVSAATACVRVRPHERQDLARHSMDPSRDPDERKLDGHVHEYREGSMGGDGPGGGGCGCN